MLRLNLGIRERTHHGTPKHQSSKTVAHSSEKRCGRITALSPLHGTERQQDLGLPGASCGHSLC